MDFPLQVDLSSRPDDEPLFLRIARAISEDIRRGRLRPGAALPGTRSLASSLGVHRNPAIAAYRELEAEGWLSSRPGTATTVSPELARDPELSRRRARPRQRPREAGFDVGRPIERVDGPAAPDGANALYGGLPDLSQVPWKALARAYRRALRAGKRGPALGYGDPQGDPRLRDVVAEMIARVRGVAAGADDVMITRGSQMAVYLAARALLAPGDVVAVEGWGYRPAWEALRAAGAELVPIGVDASGLDVGELARLAARRKVRAVYVTPHHQYPTTVLMTQPRRLALFDLARQHRIAIHEDDYDHEFHYAGRPVLPLASADTHGHVVHLGTFSKIFAPGLRLGFVTAPRAFLERMIASRVLVDRQGDLVVERAVAELIEEGELERHARRMRRVYLERREAMVAAIEKELGATLAYAVPAGGMALWARVNGVEVEPWAARAAERGVLVHTAKRFTFDGRSRPFVRLGFAAETPARIAKAIGVLARTRRG
jgi:GntR family transcriptional regulator/MocR family aminotransferase